MWARAVRRAAIRRVRSATAAPARAGRSCPHLPLPASWPATPPASPPPQRGVVFAMLPVQIPGERSAVFAERAHSREQAGHLTGIIFELREALPQKCFLRANHRQVDGKEKQNNSAARSTSCAQPAQIRSPGSANRGRADCACRHKARRWPAVRFSAAAPKPALESPVPESPELAPIRIDPTVGLASQK